MRKTVLIVAALAMFFFPVEAVSTDCTGCCSWHGGVVCRNGVTLCADGTPLSSICSAEGCDQCESNSTPTPQPPPDSRSIVVASFNIHNFGVTKASDSNVMPILADMISNFDVVAIQEIRDSSETAIQALEDEIDRLGVDYDYIAGPSLGRTSYKEQYVYFYRVAKIQLLSFYTFDDSLNDLFHREPFIARFSSKESLFDFVLINIHADPEEATDEINSLPVVVADAQVQFPQDQDIIVLGDLNADCAYFDENDSASPLRDPEYTWLITNDMDTNLAATSCTYDRIIIRPGSDEDYAGNSGVFRFDEDYALSEEQAKDVSDHYPVWSEFYIGRDTDGTGNMSDSDSGGGGGGG